MVVSLLLKRMLLPGGHKIPQSRNRPRLRAGKKRKRTGHSSFDEKGTEESSVNQPPANPVASPEEAASPPHVVPYPYQPDEVIGVCSFYPAEALSQRPLSFCRGHTTGPNSSRRPIRGQGRYFQGHVWP